MGALKLGCLLCTLTEKLIHFVAPLKIFKTPSYLGEIYFPKNESVCFWYTSIAMYRTMRFRRE